MRRGLLLDRTLAPWLIFVIALSCGLTLYALVPVVRVNEYWVALVGGSWAVTHFLHQHYLERTRFFFELFQKFNARYDAMNERLQAIATEDGLLSAIDRQVIVDYFNLCAEEFYFYRCGYLPEEVYRAWRNGMDWYARSRRFREVWEAERSTSSYYGYEFSNPASERRGSSK